MGSRTSSGKPHASEPSAKEERHEVILSSTVIGFDKGNSGSRFMTWPLPIGVSKAKARFVFRDATNNQELFRFVKEAKFQGVTSSRFATKEQQMSHLKVGLADGLVKEIKRNR